MSKILILAGILVMIGQASSYYSKSYNGYTFILPDSVMNHSNSRSLESFYGAQQWCTENVAGSTLATIPNKFVQRDISDFIESALYKMPLLRSRYTSIRLNGRYHTTDLWHWAGGQRATGFTVRSVLKENGPDGYVVGYLWTGTNLIYEGRPLEQRRYICETSKNSSSSFHCKMELNNKCYWKDDHALTWYKARNACFYDGGDLASFETLTEKDLNNSLKELRLEEMYSYWVGIYSGVWRWNDKGIDDAEIKYSNWKSNHPSNYSARCLCLDKSHNHEWIECECDKEYPFICKRDGVGITKTSAQTDQPIDQPTTSVISDTVRLALVLTSCALFVIIILGGATFIFRKQRNRPLNSYRNETREASTTTTIRTSEFSAYEELQENNASYIALQQKISG